MRFIKLVVLSALSLSGFLSTANATLYTATQDLNDTQLSSLNPIFDGGYFDIAPPFDPLTETITYAEIMINIFNPDRGSDWVKLTFDPGQNIFGATTKLGLNSVSGEVYGQALANLQADGQICYSVEWFSGGAFVLVDAILAIETSSMAETQPVPEAGSTLGLLGFALLGLHSVRRKLKHS